MSNELIYQIALTKIPGIGCVQGRTLLRQFGSASAIFHASRSSLEKIEGVGSIRANSIRQFSQFSACEKELEFIKKNKLKTFFLGDQDYPQRLFNNCYDAPLLLYFRGSAGLNAGRILAVVGTRNNSEYGREIVEKFISELSSHAITIVSGLAFGIDAIAHRSALQNGLPTIGVVGHGMDFMYPMEHRELAREMINKGGGVLTEFPSGTKPDKHNFPGRNRIVAGISDATVVIETGIKGGSIITAELANGYNRDVFAFPGRVFDRKSEGCNYLIRQNKAVLLTEANQLLELMGWNERKVQKESTVRIFHDLNENEKLIVGLLQERKEIGIDDLSQLIPMNVSIIASTLLNLEIQNVIRSLPGKRYKLMG